MPSGSEMLLHSKPAPGSAAGMFLAPWSTGNLQIPKQQITPAATPWPSFLQTSIIFWYLLTWRQAENSIKEAERGRFGRCHRSAKICRDLQRSAIRSLGALAAELLHKNDCMAVSSLRWYESSRRERLEVRYWHVARLRDLAARYSRRGRASWR